MDGWNIRSYSKRNALRFDRFWLGFDMADVDLSAAESTGRLKQVRTFDVENLEYC